MTSGWCARPRRPSRCPQVMSACPSGHNWAPLPRQRNRRCSPGHAWAGRWEPAVTRITSPVMFRARSDAKNATAFATSSGSISRLGHRLLVGNVDLAGLRPWRRPVQFADPGSCLLGRGEIPVRQDDLEPVGRQNPADHRAQAARSPGNHSHRCRAHGLSLQQNVLGSTAAQTVTEARWQARDIRSAEAGGVAWAGLGRRLLPLTDW